MDFPFAARLRNRFTHIALRRPGMIPLAGGVLLGATLTASLPGIIHYSDSNEFCVSCHEMAQGPYRDYLQSSHYRNRTGVRAGCADCHLPQDHGLAYAKAKIIASKDVFHHLMGTLDTPEKYSGRRLDMARRVWRELKATDSAPCRRCHDVGAMDPQVQGSGDMHQRIGPLGKTCVDCHQGLAHRLL